MKKLLTGVAGQNIIALLPIYNSFYFFLIIILMMINYNKATAQTQNFIISAKQKWVNTGIDLNKGQKISISSRGSWTNGGANPQQVGPAGWPTVLLNSTLAPNLPLSSLIGRVDNSAFLIGEDYTGASPVDGRLYLSMNDDDFTDNDGQLKVSVTVKPWFVTIPDGKHNDQLVLTPKFFPYKIELNTIDPGTYDQDNNIWVQTYPMPSGRSEVKFKYTLKNKINTKPGKITAIISGNKLLSSTLFPNTITEMPANANFSSEFHCSGLTPGNYTLLISYIGESTKRIFSRSGKVEFMDTLLAAVQFDYVVLSDDDVDDDGITDATEHSLLERFRPYFMFSDDDGEDQYRPCDAWRYVRMSELRTNTDEDDGNGTIVPQFLLVSNPDGILVSSGMFGSSNIKDNPGQTNYFINPMANIPGEEKDPGRHGNSWDEVRSQKNIGLYGHVVPVRLCNPDYFDFNYVLNGFDNGDLYYKIEYWQFFGYNYAHQSEIADHEGDWTSVQVLFHPASNKIISVFHFAHALDFRFNFSSTIDVRHLTNNDVDVDEFRGPNYRTDIDLVFHNLDFEAKKRDWQDAQNNVVRMFRDQQTGEFSHPVVYIENGGHEFYPTDDWNFYYAPNHNGRGYNFLTNTPPNLGEVENPLHETLAAEIILKFNGYWGTWSRKNSPPPGPALHRQWTWPATSAVRWKLRYLPF